MFESAIALRETRLLKKIRLRGNAVAHDRAPMSKEEFHEHLVISGYKSKERRTLRILFERTWGQTMTFDMKENNVKKENK